MKINEALVLLIFHLKKSSAFLTTAKKWLKTNKKNWCRSWILIPGG